MPSPTIRTYFWSTGRPSGSKAVLFTPSPHRAPSSGRSPPLLRFIEFLLRLFATRTTPVIGQVFKGNAGRDVLLGVALFRVVGVFAGAFELCHNRICLVYEFLMEHKDAKFIINGTQRHKDAKFFLMEHKDTKTQSFFICAQPLCLRVFVFSLIKSQAGCASRKYFSVSSVCCPSISKSITTSASTPPSSASPPPISLALFVRCQAVAQSLTTSTRCY